MQGGSFHVNEHRNMMNKWWKWTYQQIFCENEKKKNVFKKNRKVGNLVGWSTALLCTEISWQNLDAQPWNFDLIWGIVGFSQQLHQIPLLYYASIWSVLKYLIWFEDIKIELIRIKTCVFHYITELSLTYAISIHPLSYLVKVRWEMLEPIPAVIEWKAWYGQVASLSQGWHTETDNHLRHSSLSFQKVGFTSQEKDWVLVHCY